VANRLTSWMQKTIRSLAGLTAEQHIGMHTRARVGLAVTPDTALRNSAVWAALRIRADLISTFPLDCYRRVGEQRVSVPTPRVLVEPGGAEWDYQDWAYATQFDMDRSGNTFGLITAKDGLGFPAEIVPQALGDVTVTQKATGGIRYRIGDTEYTAWSPSNPSGQVWHERQYVVAGLPVGLSPVAYAASVISENISTQQFAEQWFARKGVPASHLRNTNDTINYDDADVLKQRFMASLNNGEPLVTGVDWEFKPLQAESMGMEWLEDRKFSLTDISRFMSVPADLIDASISGESVTYANITERNLQFLIFHLGPAVARREKNLSKLMQRPRFVKLNTDAMLRMDPKQRAEAHASALQNRWRTNAEVRALEDLKPLSAADLAEFETIYGPVVQQKTVKPAAEVENV
jgi:HK97 family phage portal protein